ncbi:MAG TPA: IPT/TIG domain-containing protein [Vicinamibacterales bacterium]|nr:IPT/TIG domain-containing protein [Vicinamibacterales bacterium]
MQPHWAVEGGRVTIHGSGFPIDTPHLPGVTIGESLARPVYASSSTIAVLVPSGLDGGQTAVRIADVPGETALLEVGAPLVTGLHQVDNPVFDREGNLYVTYSGSRGQEVPVSIFRVSPSGRRESYVSGVVNPTSMAFDAQGQLYVSSRFEGSVYRVHPEGTYDTYASDLGIACGLAFDRRGVLYVGDRSGTVFAVQPDRTVTAIATLPASVAAFHLAMGPDDCVYATGPTLGPYDYVYRIDPASGSIDKVYSGFGRPQGIAFDSQGSLYVVEALAGWNGLYRVRPDGSTELIVAGQSLVGVAFNPNGGLIVASNDTAYRLDVAIRPLM